MDYLESLAQRASELTMYDLKSAVSKVQNAVLNLTEMEAKTREATNDDKWGASSTLMKEISDATFNFQLFNEIMPTIYQRFTDKEARQWRQIYKSLVLLEFLIKNGSERVIDDARTHLSLIKVLRNFHYTDETGKDQGINVRNRSKELSELLADLDKVRMERRKAKANRNKYTGVGNDGSGGGGMSFTSSSGGRYGGFGSESMEGSSGGGSSNRDRSFADASSARPSDFEEYDAGEWDDARSRPSPSASSVSVPYASASTSSRTPRSKPIPTLPEKKVVAVVKEVNLFDFDDDEGMGGEMAPPPPPPIAKSIADDDFDDFQSAAPIPSSATTTIPFPLASAPYRSQLPTTTQSSVIGAASGSINSFDLMSAPTPATSSRMNVGAPLMGYSSMSMQPTAVVRSNGMGPALTVASSTLTKSTTSKGASSSAFDDLFSFGSTPSSSSTTNGNGNGNGKSSVSMADLAAKTRSDALFNSTRLNPSTNGGGGGGGGWDSLI